MSTTNQDADQAGKISRNDPCPCGSGKKYKKCCGFNAVPSVPSASAPQNGLEEARSQLDAQLAKYAPEVTVAQVEATLKESIKANPQVKPLEVLEKIFNDDNLMLRNRKHAERLFRAFVQLWNNIVESEKSEDSSS